MFHIVEGGYCGEKGQTVFRKQRYCKKIKKCLKHVLFVFTIKIVAYASNFWSGGGENVGGRLLRYDLGIAET